MIKPFGGKSPNIAPDAFIAPGVVVIGDVTIGAQSSLWYNTVVRGDVGRVVIGARTNIQDLCMLHMTTGRSNLLIGDDVTVGHHAVLHGCIIEDRCLIGMGAVVMDNARIGRGSVVAAGAVVREDTIVPPGSLIAGVPAKIVNTKEGEERFGAEGLAALYVHHAEQHAKLGKK